MTELLVMRNLAFSYDGKHPVLKDISFSIGAGEVVALVGRNGAGKSTLLRLLNGLLRPSAGQLFIEGKDTAAQKVHEIARVIGTVFQAPEAQIFNSTVEAELGFGPAQLDLSEKERQERVALAAKRSGLEGLFSHHPLDLDQAQKRFLAIGSVLATAPRLLLLDEAQRGLDRPSRDRLLTIIAEERAAGHAVILVCHDMEFVAACADRVLGLAEGHLAVDSPTLAFFANRELTEKVSVEQPQALRISQGLGLSPSLTAEGLAAAISAKLQENHALNP